MPDNCAVYLTRRLDADDIRTIAGALSVQGVGEVLATVRIGRVVLQLNDMPVSRLQQHLDGLAGYVRARLPNHRPTVFGRIAHVKQVIGIVIEPGFDSDGKVGNWITKLVVKGQGFIFRNPDLVEPDGRILAGPAKEPAASDEPRRVERDADDADDVTPPTPESVLRRAWALSAVVARANLEFAPPTEGRRDLIRIRTWVDEIGLAAELEPDEVDFLALGLGIRGQALVNATWRAEGLAVLAWGLGVSDLPDHETRSSPPELLRAVGFMNVARPELKPRTADELEWQARRLLGLHWRLREFGLSPKATNFRDLAEGKLWFGGFDRAGIELIDDDLAIGGAPIARADRDDIRRCTSIAVERHRAIGWLQGNARLYSEVDTST